LRDPRGVDAQVFFEFGLEGRVELVAEAESQQVDWQEKGVCNQGWLVLQLVEGPHEVVVPSLVQEVQADLSDKRPQQLNELSKRI
jgi:hypothetical protein